MTPLTQQVTSLEWSKKLRDLGVKQESCFYWIPIRGSYKLLFVGDKKHGIEYAKSRIAGISAYTVAELGSFLPTGTRTVQWLVNGRMYWNVTNVEGLTDVNADSSIGEADARAKMLAYLIENKLITLL